MSVPSMVHRLGDSLVVRSVVSGDPLFGSGEDIDEEVFEKPTDKDLPECKVKRNYSCSTCDFFTQNPRNYLYHLRDVHNEKVRIYECPNCLYASKHFQKLLRHTKMVHGESGEFKKGRKRPLQPPPEDPDDDSASDEATPSQDEAVFKCSLCSFVAKSQQQLGKHERDEHIKTKFFRCTKCTYVTHMKARFTKHVKYHSMPMIKCDLCDFRTPYKWNLDRHCKNHNGRGAFRCSACNFTADIKQSLTVHEMNHHIPPVGQAAGLGVGRRRNKVGASDTTAAEEAALQVQNENEQCENETGSKAAATAVPKLKIPAKKAKFESCGGTNKSDFVHPDDIVQHANGNVFIKSKCRWCNFKTAWDKEMQRHEERAHGTAPLIPKKRPPRPVPNLIPIIKKTEPIMSQKDISEICAKSSNSSLRDLASLFSSEDFFAKKSPQPKKPEVKTSFFDRLKTDLSVDTSLTCNLCGHESKCLSEACAHEKTCGKEPIPQLNIKSVHKLSSTRCQHCRQRCKSSNDLFNHLQTCPEAAKYYNNQNEENESNLQIVTEDDNNSNEKEEQEPHPMENRVFVWNNIIAPMDYETEAEPNPYVYMDDKQEEGSGSIDLSIRTQSPDSISSVVETTPIQTSTPIITPTSTDKVPTHGNDISIAQHKRVFKCPHCTFWASTASRFHVHIVGHLNKKPFECSLCSYRSNWRWDITKHIKLKSVRDPAHENAKVLMTDETGRRNYTKYNKYLTEINMPGTDSQETSGGMGTRPKHHENKDLPKGRTPAGTDIGQMFAKSTLRPPPPLKSADEFFNRVPGEKKRAGSDVKKTLWQCKKCSFRDPCKDKLLAHVRSHYQTATPSTSPSSSGIPSLSLNSTSGSLQRITGAQSGSGVDIESEASVAGSGPSRGQAPFQCGHCHQVSNWKHVIQRHCRLKHHGDIKVIVGTKTQEKIDMETDEIPEHRDIPQLGKYKCNQCPFSTDDEDEYRLHPEGHSTVSNLAFKCGFCNYSVSTKDEYHQHLNLHGVNNPLDFIQRQGAGESEERNNKRYKCSICPYVTNSKSQFMYHRQFHKPKNGQYRCSECSYNVSKRHLLHQHMKVHGINVSLQKQNGDVVDLDEMNDEIEEITPQSYDWQNLAEIPLVWVSKNGKFSKMYKCRYCPHVNLRKVNIQEHEKMHGLREKNPARINETEHRCPECNYVCNNAGVLSSHSKVHQGLYGTVHGLVDASKTDEEQINELGQGSFQNLEYDEEPEGEEQEMLFFCQQCPARFMKENEFDIHKDFHGANLAYPCENCTYTARQKAYVQAHAKVHTKDYQERSKALIKDCRINPDNPPPEVVQIQPDIWIVDNDYLSDTEMEVDYTNYTSKTRYNVPLSGTDLFQQKSEAEATEKMMPDSNRNFNFSALKNGKQKEKKFVCPKCPSIFEKRELFKIHLGFHGSKHQHKCSHCDFAVKHFPTFIQHELLHKAEESIEKIKEEPDDDDENIESSPEEKKPFWCKMCPYTNARKDAVDNHQKRHITISGIRNNYTCEHCDYSVPQSHILRDHMKIHFTSNKMHSADAFMSYDSMKLFAKTIKTEGESTHNDSVIFQFKDTYTPTQLNNNEGEKIFINIQTGEVVDKNEAS